MHPDRRHRHEPVSDSEILARVRSGETAVFGVLYERDAPEARRFAARLVSSRDAGDIVSEAFARVLVAIENGGGPRDHHLKYLLVTVRRTAIDWMRRKTPEPVEDLDEAEVQPIDDALDQLLDGRLQAALEGLSPRWREVLWLTEVEGASMAEAGDRLSLSPPAVAALAYRARGALRAAYLAQRSPAPAR